MRFSKLCCLILCLTLLAGAVMPVYAVQPDAPATAGCRSVDAAVPLGGSEKMLDTAKAVVVYERTTGTLVYAYNLDGRIYPSSMVKLMTAIVALECGNLDDIVTVTRSALDSVAIGSVSANLQRGEEISLRDLMYLMMVASANDASAVIAEHVGGSQAEFIKLMNDMAVRIGCTDTNFSNVTGLHADDTYTTARDILKIMEYGLEIEEFKTMFETVSYTVPATNKSEERTAVTTNNMMINTSKNYDERVTGGKTGSTDLAGRCLAVTAKTGDMELIAVVMGAKATYADNGKEITRFGSFEEMEELLDYTQKNYECRQLFYEGQIIAQYAVADGSSLVVTTPADATRCVLPKGTAAEDLTWNYAQSLTGLTAPIEAGQEITALEVWYGNICLGTTQLLAMNAVEVDAPLTENRITENEKQEQAHGELIARILGIILGAAVGIALLLFVGLLSYRAIQRAVIKSRVRRRRRNRRRNRNARME